MSRTQSALYSDIPHQGGWIWAPATDLTVFSANLVLTRNALGDYSYNRTAAGAETYQLVTNLQNLKRLIEVPTPPMPFQEQFGSGASGPSAWPGGAQGVPPFTGSTFLNPPSGQPPKGLRVIDVAVVYTVGVAALTAASLSLNQTTYANNVANAITNIPINATALALATQVNPYVAVRAVTTPTFLNTDLSDLYLEFSATLQNTGTIRIYGIGYHCDFNYN